VGNLEPNSQLAKPVSDSRIFEDKDTWNKRDQKSRKSKQMVKATKETGRAAIALQRGQAFPLLLCDVPPPRSGSRAAALQMAALREKR
jgi:hypothetical protein